MNIIINGEPTQVSAGASVARLIESLNLGQKRFAIEVNEEVVRRSEYDNVVLSEGDCVEVVQAIGGG